MIILTVWKKKSISNKVGTYIHTKVVMYGEIDIGLITSEVAMKWKAKTMIVSIYVHELCVYDW